MVASGLGEFELIGVIAGGVLVGVALIVCAACSLLCARRDRRKDLIAAAGTRRRPTAAAAPGIEPPTRSGAVDRVLATQDLLVPPYDRVPSVHGSSAEVAPLQRQTSAYAEVQLPSHAGYAALSVNRGASEGAYDIAEPQQPNKNLYTAAPAARDYGGAQVLVAENYGGGSVLARSNEHSAHYTELRTSSQQQQSDVSLPTMHL